MCSRKGSIALAVFALLPASLLAAAGMAAGVRWTVPTGWAPERDRPMRVATYAIPAAKGADTGECGIYFFGRGQGGGVDENIARWSQQFQGAPKAARSERTVRGIALHRVAISGTYLSPGGPMMQSESPRPHYRLLGAIVEAPGGFVFFKCTGPEATMAAAEKGFDSLLASLTKVPAASF